VMGDHLAGHVAPLVMVEVAWQAPPDDPAMQPNPCASVVPPKAIDATTRAQRWVVSADTEIADGLWQAYTQPADMRYLLDVCLGRLTLDRPRRGTYTLYVDNACQPQILFSSLPEPDYSRSPFIVEHLPVVLRDNVPGYVANRSLTPPAGATCLSALPDPANQGDSSLFVGGEGGLYRFRSTAQSKGASPELLRADAEVQRLVAIVSHQDRARVALWGLNNAQELVYLGAPQGGAASDFSVPMVLYRGVAHMAPRVNRRRSSDELFVTTSDSTTVGHLWRDPASTAWLDSDLVLPSLDVAQEFQCYTTVIKLVDAQSNPVSNQPVQLNASAWAWVMVNGSWMQLDADAAHPVGVLTDSTGAVTIINKVSDLGTPVFSLAADFLDAPVLADPSAELRQALLDKISANPDITTWTKPDGSLLVPPDADPDAVAQAQATLDTLLNQVAGTLPPDGSVAGGDAPTAAAATSKRRVTQLNVLGDIGDAIETAAGDVMQALKSAGQAVYDYVVEPIVDAAEATWQFAVNLAGTVVSFVIRTIDEVLQLVSWLFQTIGAVLQDIIEFVGFLFSWDDIVDTHKVIANMGKQSLLYMAAMVKAAEPLIEDVFDRAIVGLQTICRRAADLPDQDLKAIGQQTSSQAPAGSTDAMAWLGGSAGGTFSSYQLQHGGVTDADPPVSDYPVAEALQVIVATVQRVWDDCKDALEGFASGLSALIKSDQFTLRNVALLVTDEVVSAALGAMRDVLIGVCEIAGDLVQALVDDVLCKEVNIPILTGLYARIAEGSPLTLLDAGALLLAIPSTMVYKLMSGEAPFPDGVDGWDTATWQELFPIPAALSGTLMLAESEGFGRSEQYARYSRIGGIAAQISTVLYAMLLPASVYAQESGRKWLGRLTSALQACLFAISVGCTFPFDDDDTQWYIDLFNWGFGLIIALVGGATAILNGSAFAAHKAGRPDLRDQLIKLAETVLGPLNSVVEVLAGVVLVVVGLVSLVLELEDDDKPEYHTTFWDLEKFVGNLISGGATASEGVADLIEQPEILLGTSVAYGFSVWLSFARNVEAAFDDHLFQSV
ncbi:MAG TPA: hypothetical protein PKA64_06320, partial [Myxococcota bacterium]|nr:hypothetical protein [Myxococcota bacterium]